MSLIKFFYRRILLVQVATILIGTEKHNTQMDTAAPSTQERKDTILYVTSI